MTIEQKKWPHELEERAEDLLADLNQIEDKTSCNIISPGGVNKCVNDIIKEIRERTDQGRRLVELDAKAAARFV